MCNVNKEDAPNGSVQGNVHNGDNIHHRWTDELAHLEMVAAILYQLTRNASEEEIANSPFAPYFVDHTTGIYTVAAAGVPFDMKYVGIKGDVITDLNEDLAADAAIIKEQPLRKKS